jgi:hypothetical protein
VEIETRGGPRLAERRASRQRGEAFRGRAAAGGASRRVGVDHPAAGERAPGEGRRRTNRSPGAIASGSARTEDQDDLAARQVAVSRPLRPTVALDAGRASVDQHPALRRGWQRVGRAGAVVASGRRRAAGDEDPIRRDDARSEVSVAPRAIAVGSTPARLIACRPSSARADVAAVDQEAAHPDQGPARHESAGRVSRSTGPRGGLPVTTVAAAAGR